MKYFYFSWLMLTICACHATPTVRLNSGTTNTDIQRNVTIYSNNNISANLNIEGLYFGVSDNQLGRRAWLLRLKKGEGILYMPPNNLAIPQVEISPTGHINFQSNVGLGNVTYSFRGQFTSNTIQGEFRLSSVRPSSEKTSSAEVALQRIDLSSLNKKNVAGLYSNVQYVEEGGDLVGEDLILIPYQEELIGIFTSYENEMIPYAVNIKQSKNKIKFNIKTDDGEQNFQGLISARSIKLWRNDMKADPEAEPMILPRKQLLSDILTKASKF